EAGRRLHRRAHRAQGPPHGPRGRHCLGRQGRRGIEDRGDAPRRHRRGRKPCPSWRGRDEGDQGVRASGGRDMPVFRIGDRLHYYAHVPKCGGSSVEAYLKARFGGLAFLNTRFLDLPEARRWTRSSPQHLPWDAFTRLVPADWIASSFAVVRHPVRRLVSAFQYQVEVEGTVAPLWSIDE